MLIVMVEGGWCYFWNLDLTSELRRVDLTSCTNNNRLFNITVCDMEVGINELMICTTEGDLLSISLDSIRNSQN